MAAECVATSLVTSSTAVAVDVDCLAADAAVLLTLVADATVETLVAAETL
jgi:hypothetical protein